MIVVFHVLVGAGIAHVAATSLRTESDVPLRRPNRRLFALACLVGLLSHGVLDGLKHGYPLSGVPDIAVAVVLAATWLAAVRPELRWLFAAVIAAALLPDVIDLGPAMLHSHTGLDVPVPSSHVFPWHWPDGSGSLHPGGPGSPPDTARNLDAGFNRLVSLVNYFIVFVMAVGCVATSPWAFRFVRRPEYARAA